MLTRRERREELAMEEFINAFIDAYFNNLEVGTFTFLDEIYRIFAVRIAELREVMKVKLSYPDEHSIVRSDLYSTLFEKAKLAADLSYRMIPEAFERIGQVANNLIERSESLTAQLTVCDDIVKALEGSLKKKVSITSVKNEILVYDTIGTDTKIIEGDLSVDRRAGVVVLGIKDTTEIDFSIEEVKYDKPKGTMKAPKVGDMTWDNIENGYFTSRSFSSAPLLESERTMDIKRMVDNDFETSYLVEYNTTSDRDALNMNLELSFDLGRVDILSIVVDPGDYESVTTSSVVLPSLTKIITRGERTTEDITDIVTDNIVEMKGTSAGTVEAEITHKRPDIYPIGSFFLCRNSIDRLSIVLSSEKPQEIFYPEKVVRDVSGNLLHRFNYFETLVLNRYEPLVGHLNPREFYTAAELAEMNEISNVGHTVLDKKRNLFRYFIGVKELRLLRATYKTEGECTTANLNDTNKKVAGVELYVNERIPKETSIIYSISINRVNWHEIAPQGRVDSGGAPRRIVFHGFEATIGDKLVDLEAESMYLKINMTGTGSESPVINAYALRIKLL
jgi:hypothetical protein